jgi:hypothetical protein
MKSIFLLVLACVAFAASAAPRTVATIADPAGDDDGDGLVVYPQRNDFQPGDLDLVSLAIVRDDGRYRFEATFRNPVRDPATVRGDVGAESLGDFARRGFYAFNVDVYIDLDRVKGSGNTFTLPGRKAQVDAAHAWERAVVLTPRPELMRQQLIETLVEAEADASRAAVAARIDAMVHFATDVRVRGRTIAFSVPAAFFAAGRPDTDWSVVAFVTGAKTSIEADLQLVAGSGSALDRLVLGAMQPAPGRPRDTFGYRGERVTTPIVDLLAPAGGAQAAHLARGVPLVGVTWSATAAAIEGNATPVASLVGARAAAPAAATPVSPPASPAAATPAAPVVPAAPVAAPVAPASVPAAAAPSPAAVAPAPSQPPAGVQEPAASAPRAPARGSIAERLQALKDLFDRKLIEETEYKQQRQRILNEL